MKVIQRVIVERWFRHHVKEFYTADDKLIQRVIDKTEVVDFKPGKPEWVRGMETSTQGRQLNRDVLAVSI